MRQIGETLAAKLAFGVTTLCHIWRVQRRDGEAFAFTDHDHPLPFEDASAEPLRGVSAGSIEKSVGLSVDTASIHGALSSEAITEDDLARGLWDGARVDIYRLDWSAPDERIHLFSGRVGEVKRGAQAFEAELRGLGAVQRPCWTRVLALLRRGRGRSTLWRRSGGRELPRRRRHQ